MPFTERIEILKKVLDLYIENWHNIYLSHGYTSSMLQIRADCSTSRTHSNKGNKRIEQVLVSFGFVHSLSLEQFLGQGKNFIFPNRGDKKIFNQFLREINFEYNFKQNKLPDVAIFANEKYYFLEHKIVNSNGGHQNEQLDEVISFIEQGSIENMSFISYLSGSYFNQFAKNNLSPKAKNQKQSILINLKKNRNNYFVNDYGLQLLF